MTTDSTTPQKTCTKCSQTFPATAEYFHVDKYTKDGLTPRCKVCRRAYHHENRDKRREHAREYRQANQDTIAEQKREYYQANRDKLIEYDREYRQANPDKVRERHRKYHQENQDKVREHDREYYQANKDIIAEKGREYRQANPDKVRERHRKYQQANQDKVREYRRGYYQANRDKLLEDNRKYYQANREKYRIRSSRREARKRNLPDTFTEQQWLACLEYHHYCCAVCGKQLRDLLGFIEPHADHWIPLSYEGEDNPGTVAENVVCLCNECNLSKNAKLPGDWLKEQFGTRKANEILARVNAYFEQVKSE